MIRREETIDWYLSEPGVTARSVDADEALTLARERKSLHKQKLKSDAHRRNTISELIGRSRQNGTLTEAGKHVEIWLPYEPVHTGAAQQGEKLAAQKRSEESEESIARRCNSRARKQIRRLVNANNFQGMITLTFAPPSKDNNRLYNTVEYDLQRDYDFCRRRFKDFVDRARLWRLHFEYVAVFEIHNSEKTSEEKRGCWHIHLACSVDGNGKEASERLWGHGIVDYQDFRFDREGNRRQIDICNPGAYIAEYIGKEGAQFGGGELRMKRRYTCSRGCKRPKSLYLKEVHIEGDFDEIEYDGKTWKNEYYSASEIPGTDKLSITAHYREV